MSTQTEVKKDTFKDTVLERTKLHGVQDKEGPTNSKNGVIQASTPVRSSVRAHNRGPSCNNENKRTTGQEQQRSPPKECTKPPKPSSNVFPEHKALISRLRLASRHFSDKTEFHVHNRLQSVGTGEIPIARREFQTR